MRFIFARHTSLLVIFSLITFILLGTVLFLLPQSTVTGCSFIDALFTSTSAICSIGILTLPFASLTTFGKILLLMLIQIGGIGIVTLFMILTSLFSQVGMEWYSIAHDLYEIIERRLFKKFFIISFTYMIIIETSGALLFKYLIAPQESFFTAFFYAIDCFCNAGFSSNSPVIMHYTNHNLFYIIGFLMMFLGGLGFLFAFELFNKVFSSHNTKNNAGFSFTIRFGLLVYSITTFIAWIAIFLLKSNSYSFGELCKSLFSAMSFRSCGINPYDHFSQPFVLCMAAYGIFGTLPFATGGGLKSSIIGLFFLTLYSITKKVKTIIVLGKQIMPIYLLQAHMYISYLFFIVFTASLLIDYLSTSVYNFALLSAQVCGLLVGTGLSWLGNSDYPVPIKLLFIIIIFIGKIGSIWLHVRIFSSHKNTSQKPEAKIIMF